MDKKFDSVKFQRKRRSDLSSKVVKMSPSDIVKAFRSRAKINKSKTAAGK